MTAAESMVTFECDCGFMFRAPVGRALELMKAHDADGQCPIGGAA